MPVVSVPERRLSMAQWGLVGGAAVFAIAVQALPPGVLKDTLAYPVALLPGILTAVVFRSVLAGIAVTLAPMYFVIGFMLRGLPAHRPMLAIDQAWPLRPEWMLVYGSLYVFVVILPFFVVRQRDLGQRTLGAYISVMLVAYAGFLLYPTIAPLRGEIAGGGFAVWTLRGMYDLDTPYNCFPSLHVAYAFIAALACYRVHRGVGLVSVLWAGLIGVSTLYTKQHYLVDVIAGALMGWLACVVFFRGHARETVALDVRRHAPLRAAAAAGAYVVMVVAIAVVYALSL